METRFKFQIAGKQIGTENFIQIENYPAVHPTEVVSWRSPCEKGKGGKGGRLVQETAAKTKPVLLNLGKARGQRTVLGWAVRWKVCLFLLQFFTGLLDLPSGGWIFS